MPSCAWATEPPSLPWAVPRGRRYLYSHAPSRDGHEIHFVLLRCCLRLAPAFLPRRFCFGPALPAGPVPKVEAVYTPYPRYSGDATIHLIPQHPLHCELANAPNVCLVWSLAWHSIHVVDAYFAGRWASLRRGKTNAWSAPPMRHEPTSSSAIRTHPPRTGSSDVVSGLVPTGYQCISQHSDNTAAQPARLATVQPFTPTAGSNSFHGIVAEDQQRSRAT